MRRALRGVALLLPCILAACASAPPRTDSPAQAAGAATSTVAPASEPGARLAALAYAQLGVPYRRAGSDPGGFDCSGLVVFVHAAIGLKVPRTAAAQSAAATPVAREALRAGDLVFFRVGDAGIDHVGIYTGDGGFVHAPGSGRGVERVSLDHPWFNRRYAGAGRFWTVAEPAGASH